MATLTAAAAAVVITVTIVVTAAMAATVVAAALFSAAVRLLKIAVAATAVVITAVTAAMAATATTIAVAFRPARRRAVALRLLRFARRPVVAPFTLLRLKAPSRVLRLTLLARLRSKPLLRLPKLPHRLAMTPPRRRLTTTNFCLRGLLPRSLRLQVCQFPLLVDSPAASRKYGRSDSSLGPIFLFWDVELGARVQKAELRFQK